MLLNTALLLALSTTSAATLAAKAPTSSADIARRSETTAADTSASSAVLRQRGGRSLTDYGEGDLLPRGDNLNASGGSGSWISGKGTINQGGVKLNYYTVTISPGTGFTENFIVYAPMTMSTAPRPMLVAFHGFGVSQNDIPFNTPLIQQAAARNWFLVAPLSASGGHFMCDPGQANTEAAINWMLGYFKTKIDKSRIYGLGFSMGGGMALNFAARHLNFSQFTFAALFDHSGAVDLNNVYDSDPAARYVFDYWYGDGSAGSADTTKMSRASVIQWSTWVQGVNPTNDLVRNLSHIPLKIIRASNDPLAYLSAQSDTLNSYLTSMGRVPGPTYSYEVRPSSVHNWNTMDATEACDWLGQFQATMPLSGRTLAVSKSTYFHFFVDIENTATLAPFTWNIDLVANELRISETSNLKSLAVNMSTTGLSTLQPVQVVLGTADGQADKVILTGYPAAPSQVLRDGVPAAAGSWAYNAVAKNMSLTETDGAAVHAWTVIP